MIPSLVRDLIENPTREVLDVLYAAETQVPFLWIDWREDDAGIAATCDAIVGPCVFAAEWRGDDRFVRGRGREVQVLFEQDAGDRHRALVACNESLAPTHEIRFVWETDGADTGELLLLSADDWESLESDHGHEAVGAAYLALAPHPNLFTDPLHALLPKRPAPPSLGSHAWWRFR